MKRSTAAIALCLLAGSMSETSRAQNPSPMDIRACTAIESDAQRLACYDHATRREDLPVRKRTEASAMADAYGKPHAAQASATESNGDAAHAASLLDSRWELAAETKLGTFNVRG